MSQSAGSLATQQSSGDDAALAHYLDTLSLVERLHRLLLDVIKDEFERLGRFEVNAVQALLLFNIGDKEMTAGELKSRGYYQGSNVSYNLKKLVEGGFVHHERSEVDRRSVRIRLAARGREVHDIVAALFGGHAAKLVNLVDRDSLEGMNRDLRMLERFWTEQIRYMY